MATGKSGRGGGTILESKIAPVEVLPPMSRAQDRLVGPALAVEPARVSSRVFGPQHVLPNGVRRGLGRHRDLPDLRDMTLTRLPARLVTRAGEEDLHARATGPIADAAAAASLPSSVDHRAYCSPIEDQGQLGSCTANACVGMVEYMERRATGRHVDGSRLYVYKTTRKLLGWTGDTGAFLRSTMKALVLFGVTPEETWPYDISSFDDEPDPYMYAYGANYKAVRYLRLDPPSQSTTDTLKAIKGAVSRGYAAMFGFTVYNSMGYDADIPYPSATDTVDGGHAMLVVGYDDNRPCKGPASPSKGAFLIRNSWGTIWGDNGYGWLPYAYVLNGLADDFWTCFTMDWVDSGKFD